ncbi:hypothetical protein [Streptomyces sp. NPDC058755]|uniref:hypothetical protein n=1 Tax=Streptomyces sp. NPDC058755 TaxID=3346624 RepID=UPI0036C35309
MEGNWGSADRRRRSHRWSRSVGPAADPDFSGAIALRRADDAGKVVGLRVADLEVWRPVVQRVAAG